ncbi:MAG: thiamine pyrophosphate-binding protein [Legionellaceae bacterium]|nr:thiamine pyrophosphate-binding protein [Legionellaceae bacterium]MBP9774745.1 thiamine pyrophosphate-binding protein [Legionellaceae bacterium]
MGSKNTTDYILETLKNEGVTHVFLVPGFLIDPFLSGFARNSQLCPIIAAHEEGAAYMADGYARASGLFGAVICIGGPGVTNTTTAIAVASADRIPVFLISGDVPVHWQGRGFLQDSTLAGINETAILSSVTRMQLDLPCVELLEHHCQTLLRKMYSPAAPGPVHLMIAEDIQQKEVPQKIPKKLPSIVHKQRILDHSTLPEVWQHLSARKKIMIIAGAGVTSSDASKELIIFAERYAIPVATTSTGKGVFPENHPLSLGCAGWFGSRWANETLISGEVEVLIILGSRLSMMDLCVIKKDPVKQVLIANDINFDSIFRSFTVDVPVLGDCQEFLKTLNNTMDATMQAVQAHNATRNQWLVSIKNQGTRVYFPENCLSTMVPIHPARVIHELRQIMPTNTILTVDNGAHTLFVGHYWETYGPREFFTSLSHMGSVGWGVPAGIGISIARPDAPSVIITGDGCMLMNGVEIQTAARYNLPIIVIVINNSAYGNPNLRSKTVGVIEDQLTLLPSHDFAAFARALGAEGFTVDKPEELSSTFLKALSLKKTVLVDVKCGNYPTPTKIFDHGLKFSSY